MRRTMNPPIPPRNRARRGREGNCRRGPGPSTRSPGASPGSSLDTQSDEIDRAVPVSVAVEIERATGLRQASQLRAVTVDEVLEVRDDVAASVVLEALHVLDDRSPLLRVDRRECLVVEGDELRVLGGRIPM